MTPSRGAGTHRLLVPVLAVVALGVGIAAMREATQSRHEVMPPGSSVRIVLEPHSKRPEGSQRTSSVVTAHLAFCQLEVGSRMEGDPEVVSREPLRYSVVMAPALDSTDRKQFRGCVEDWIVDNHRIDVIEMEELQQR